MTRSRYYYLMVTKDEFELPLIVADSPSELAKLCGISKGTIDKVISRQEHGRRPKYFRKKQKAEGTFRRVRREDR